MSWFEQATSTIRCSIIQFHRPVKLKLKRRYQKCLHSRMFITERTVFLLLQERWCLKWTVVIVEVCVSNGWLFVVKVTGIDSLWLNFLMDKFK